MDRITDKHLQALAQSLNKMTHSPMEYMTDGKINIGHFHISHAYSGVNLGRTVNEGGGVSCPISYGHIPKRQLYDLMHAFISGIEFGQDMQAKADSLFTKA